MKIYLSIFFLVLSFFANANDKKDSITINFHFNAPGITKLIYYDDFLVEKTLTFRNMSKRDTTITRKLFTNYILEFRNSHFDGINNKSYFALFFAKGGDTINLKLNGWKLENIGTNQMLFVSDFLQINDSIFFMLNEAHSDLETKIKNYKYEHHLNLKLIDSLLAQKKLNDSTANLFTLAANNSCYFKLSRLNYNADSPDRDSLTIKLRQGLMKKSTINSSFYTFAIYSTTYHERLKNKLNSNLTTFLKQVIDINTEKRHKIGVAFEALNNFPEKTSKMYAEAYALFKQNLENEIFLQQEYAKYIFPNQMEFDKSVVKLLMADKRQVSLADIFRENKGKWIVFDFWASWCVPCINEFTFLETAKQKLKGKNIVFIGISLDKDSKENDWLTSLKKNNISNKNQFRVIEKSDKDMSSLYKIESIPKYLVFDSNGILVNDQFLRPSDKDFVGQLLRYIDKK
jgi:thiol-disulfide isomerase/thioredoxin